MSENPDQPREPEYLKWFRENYPSANAIFARISRSINEVYGRSRITTDSLPIDLYQMHRPDGFSQLGARDSAVVFYAMYAKTLIDIISEGLKAEITPKFVESLKVETRNAVKEYVQENFPIRVENFKRCPKCNYDSSSTYIHCPQCGTKL